MTSPADLQCCLPAEAYFLVLIQAFSESCSKLKKKKIMTVSLHFPTRSSLFQQKCLRWIFEGGSVVSDVTEFQGLRN